MNGLRWGILLALGLAATGCGLVVGTVAVGTAVVVGTVGAVGYTVYKGGEAVVSGVESVGSSAKSLVVSDGNLEAEADYSVPELHDSAQAVMKEIDFRDIQGTRDGMSGALRATTALGERVDVRFQLVKEDRTSIRIRIGDGNIAQAEILYDRTIARLAGSGTPGGAGGAR